MAVEADAHYADAISRTIRYRRDGFRLRWRLDANDVRDRSGRAGSCHAGV
jgi:hypothetical protein